MRIAIDYDNTFSSDPVNWFNAMSFMKRAGHEIIGVTGRHPWENEDISLFYFDLCDTVIYTSGEFKRHFITNSDHKPIDVWIDDQPDMIVEHYQVVGHPL